MGSGHSHIYTSWSQEMGEMLCSGQASSTLTPWSGFSECRLTYRESGEGQGWWRDTTSLGNMFHGIMESWRCPGAGPVWKVYVLCSGGGLGCSGAQLQRKYAAVRQGNIYQHKSLEQNPTWRPSFLITARGLIGPMKS